MRRAQNLLECFRSDICRSKQKYARSRNLQEQTEALVYETQKMGIKSALFFQAQQIKYFCKRKCRDYIFDATVNYYNIEPADNSSDTRYMTNRFHIFYDSKRRFRKTERPLISLQQLMASLGELTAVFAGMSITAFIHDLSLLGTTG